MSGARSGIICDARWRLEVFPGRAEVFAGRTVNDTANRDDPPLSFDLNRELS
jgi:hypothetical protein